jgi:hypothetical protein
MRFLGVVTLEKVLAAVRAGQPVDDKLLTWAEATVAREKTILIKRAQRSADFFAELAERVANSG